MGQYCLHLCDMVLGLLLGVLLFVALFNVQVDEIGIGPLPRRTVSGEMSNLSTLEAGVAGVSTASGPRLTSLNWLKLASLGWSCLGSPPYAASSPIVVWCPSPA